MGIMFIKRNIDFGFRKFIEILTVEAYPNFCSRYQRSRTVHLRNETLQ